MCYIYYWILIVMWANCILAWLNSIELWNSTNFNGFDTTIALRIEGEGTKLFFHEKNQLANELTSKTVLLDRGWFDIYLKKKVYSQTPLTRLPCTDTNNHYDTCKEKHLTQVLEKQHKCQAPILKSGVHLGFNQSYPKCSKENILEVRRNIKIQTKDRYTMNCQWC